MSFEKRLETIFLPRSVAGYYRVQNPKGLAPATDKQVNYDVVLITAQLNFNLPETKKGK